MEDRGLRDIERWRDKIEVRLDNRQVFFLFFGSALVACMLFVLGVIVGKRLESRGRAVSPEIEDPLALLDKVATSPRPAQSGVTFPQALFGTTNRASADKHAKKNWPPAADDESASHKTIALAKPGEGTIQAAPLPVVENKLAPVKPAVKPESKSAVAAAEEKFAQPAPNKAKPAETKPAEAKPAEVKESKPAVIPTVAAAVGGVAVDGSDPLNQAVLRVTNQVIAPWVPGAALWLVWEMASPAGKSQGLGIDDVRFSASVWPSGMSAPALGAQVSGTNLLLSCPTIAGLGYQVEYKTNLTIAPWLPLGGAIPGNGDSITFTNDMTLSAQSFYRVVVLP